MRKVAQFGRRYFVHFSDIVNLGKYASITVQTTQPETTHGHRVNGGEMEKDMFIHSNADLTRTEYRWQVEHFEPVNGWQRWESGIKTKAEAEKIRRYAYRCGYKTRKYCYAVTVYDPEKIRFRIWALQQDNLHRSDIIDRSKDPGHIKAVTENIKQAENEIKQLNKLLEEV